ncbi:helix-turn-helix domain-containing protein [Streptomyces sp. NPDC057638]|uniref:helix-turn-helix domain-containing protein n=1 Tax=Streptomyces sp. NPDC057638 TaxID=3346190 RepID=UPI0036847FEF
MLGAIGLDERQESAYRALVTLGAADVADLAHRLALPESDTERTLRRLERHGLAARSSVRGGRWVASHPGVALGALLTRQRRELERAEAAAVSLARQYREEAAADTAQDLVEMVTGAGAVERRLAQLGLGAADEVCALATSTGPLPETPPGVTLRVVVEQGYLHAPGAVAALAGCALPRVADRVPSPLVIADRALAIVPLTVPGAEPAALVVHASALLEALVALFDTVWERAMPLRLAADRAGGPAEGTGPGTGTGPGPGPDAMDLEILSLLLAGMTDARVAKELELGLRTVQRRVKGLMELTGVTTRLQLGWHAHASGWVTRDLGR